MKPFLKNLALGVPLAFGAMLTLAGVSQAISSDTDEVVTGIFLGLIGIPILFATLSAVLKD